MRGAWFVPTIPVFDYTKFACGDNVVNEYIVNTQPQRKHCLYVKLYNNFSYNIMKVLVF